MPACEARARAARRAGRRRLAARLCALLPLLPWPAAGAAELTERQVALLTNNCVQCHARPDIGVPQLGDAPAWKERARQGEDQLLVHVVLGLRGMPPLGGCSACSEQDLRALIRFMAALPAR
jgi:cytochrome c5